MNIRSKTLKRVAKFCLSGGVGVGLYYITLYSLTELVHVWYVASAISAYVINQVTNFILQKLWTFENGDTKDVHVQAIKYIGMGLLFLLLNTTLLYMLVEWVHIQLYISQVILTLILSILSYFITRKIFTT